MADLTKSDLQLVKQLTALSLDADGVVDAEKVAGVLAYLEKHPPASPMGMLKAYHRRISIELAKFNAVVEHAGSISDTILGSISGALSQKYHRPIAATARQDDSLIAGLRVRIADDVYESTVAGQLDTLANSL
ncbi:F0F1 ATP synthase subunit delta [Opitutaceae bacterium]|nr:F0F1 ATP synthase subunit delta [Opitutaceae bacterium]